MNSQVTSAVRSSLSGHTIWITGAGGLLGSCFAQRLPMTLPASKSLPLARGQLDLADFRSVATRFKADKPALVIHCAALSRSPECQADPARARLLNVEVTRYLASLSAEIPFVFFSTDLVFDGKTGNYAESAPVNPLSCYAETKVEAEQIVLQNPNHTVVRTSLNAGKSPTGDRGFNEQWRNAWVRGQNLRLFIDEFRTPIHATTTVRATLDLVLAAKPGLYHVAGAQKMSRYEMGLLLAERCPELHPRFEPASIAEYQGTPRPPDTSLDCSRAQSLLSFQLPGLPQFLKANPQEFY